MEQFTSDKKMLELFEILKDQGKVRTQEDFCTPLGMLRQNFYQVKNPGVSGRIQHFTPEHIQAACKHWNVDANWIFGFAKEPFKGVTLKVT